MTQKKGEDFTPKQQIKGAYLNEIPNLPTKRIKPNDNNLPPLLTKTLENGNQTKRQSTPTCSCVRQTALGSNVKSAGQDEPRIKPLAVNGGVIIYIVFG